VHLPLTDAQYAAAARPSLSLERLDVALELIEVVHAVVAHADAAHLPLLDGLDERVQQHRSMYASPDSASERATCALAPAGSWT